MAKNSVADQAWVRIQKKTFTKWTNMHLAKRRLSIEDLQTELDDGLNLIALLEILSTKSLGRHEKKPRMRIQKIGNLNLALKFIQDSGVRLTNIGPADILDHNLKLVLGLIWTIIQKFTIADISEGELTAKEALLLWCQRKTKTYDNVSVKNFTSSFQNGLAFCALIHVHKPNLIDYASLSADDPATALRTAFEVAEKELGIPALLDVEDMLEYPDEKSVIAYVAEYYRVFSSSQQQDIAGRRVGKLVEFMREMQKLQDEYQTNAKSLADWIERKTEEHGDREFDNTLEGVQAKTADFNEYKKSEKPPKQAEKLALEDAFSNIQMKLSTHNRPAYVPPAGLGPDDINQLWSGLGDAERGRDAALRDELSRQQRIQRLRNQFWPKAEKLDAWAASKQQYLQREEQIQSLGAATTALKLHDQFDGEYTASQRRVEVVNGLGQQLVELNSHDKDQVQEKMQSIAGEWNNLKSGAATKRAALEEALAREQRKEELRKEFARLANEYNQWAHDQVDAAAATDFGDSLQAVEAFASQLDSDDAQVREQSAERLGKLDAVHKEGVELGITDNRYTALSMEDERQKSGELDQALEQRRVAYQAELEHQRALEAKRIEFAEAAAAFAQYVVEQREAADSLGGEPVALSAQLEEQREAAGFDGRLDAVRNIDREAAQMGVISNPHTDLTVAVLESQVRAHSAYVEDYRAELAEEQRRKEDYEKRAAELSQWIVATTASLQGEVEHANTLAGAAEAVRQHSQYKNSEKATKNAARAAVAAQAQDIEAALQSSAHDRPSFAPATSVATLEEQWGALEAAEKERESALYAELERQERLAKLAAQLASEASALEQFVQQKEAYYAAQENVDSLDAAQVQLTVLQTNDNEVSAKQDAVQAIEKLAAELAAENYSEQEATSARAAAVRAAYDALQGQSDSKRGALQEALAAEQEKDRVRKQFATDAKAYDRWVRKAVAAIKDTQFGESAEAVEAYQADDAKYSSESGKLRSATEANAAGAENNRYTNLSLADVEARAASLDAALAARQQAHQEALSCVREQEEKRKAFAAAADRLVALLDEQRGAINAVQGAPQERQEGVRAVYQDGQVVDAQLAECAAADQACKSVHAKGNKHTEYTLARLQKQVQLFKNYVKNLLAGVDNEMALAERAAAAEAELQQQTKRDNLRLEYADKVQALNQWLEVAEDDATEEKQVDSLEQAEAAVSNHQKVAAGQSDAEGKLAAVRAVGEQMSEAGADAAPSVADVEAQFAQVCAQVAERGADVEAELQRQQANEALRVSFAEKASALDALIDSLTQKLNKASGDLTERLAQVESVKGEKADKEGEFRTVAEEDQKLADANVLNNPHTTLTFAGLEVSWNQLRDAIDEKVSLLQQELAKESSSGLSSEQLAEIKAAFNHFARDGVISGLGFMGLLKAIGQDATEDEAAQLLAKLDKDNSGALSLPEFIEYYQSVSADTDTADQLVSSFAELANGADFITEEQMRAVMDGAEVDYLVANMPKVDGGFDYKSYVASCY